MAKEREQIKDFSGGINNYDDPRDLSKNEFTDVQNWLVNRRGQIRTLKSVQNASDIDSTLPTNRSSSKIIPNFGMFSHGTDNVSGSIGATKADTGEYWIYKSDPSNMSIDAYSTSEKAWYGDRINLYSGSGTKTDILPSYYADEGYVRVCDSNFGAESVNQYHGYVENKMFQTDDAGTSSHHIQRWQTGYQELKSLEDLGVSMYLWNYGYYNKLPDESRLNDQKKLWLAYWLTPGGKFNGQYEFGLSPIYTGQQEGPITIIKTTGGVSKRQMYDHTLHLQLFVSMGSISTLNAASAHVLGDDRMVGINCYFRHYTQEVWYHLKYFDLQRGDKYHWGSYASTENLYGKWIGSLAMGDLSEAGSYKNTDVPVTIDLNSGVGFGENPNPERDMTLRLDGSFTTPIYKEVTVAGVNQIVNINVKNPSSGTSNYKVTLLDEAYAEVDTQNKDYTISDSTLAAPAVDHDAQSEAYDSYYDGG